MPINYALCMCLLILLMHMPVYVKVVDIIYPSCTIMVRASPAGQPLLHQREREGLASSPGLREGEEREGLVSTACACTVIMQILNNPITYGYCLVYLPFDLNSSRSTYLEMTVWTVQVSRESSRELERRCLVDL